MIKCNRNDMYSSFTESVNCYPGVWYLHRILISKYKQCLYITSIRDNKCSWDSKKHKHTKERKTFIGSLIGIINGQSGNCRNKDNTENQCKSYLFLTALIFQKQSKQRTPHVLLWKS